MNTPNIVMTRIDERLIHGQGHMWLKATGCNTVIVANDKVSEDMMQQTLMKTVVPNDVAMRFFSVNKVIEVIGKANPAQKIFLVIKDVQDALRLVEGNVPISHLNLGNIHNAQGKEQVTRSIFLSEEEKAIIKTLHEKHHVTFDTKTTPTEGNAAVEVDILKFV